MVASVPQV